MTDSHYAVFAPRRTRVIAIVTAAAFAVLMAVLTFTVPGVRAVDAVGFALLALLMAWFMWRQARVRAVPSPDGLVVVNLFITTRLEWAQIVSVRFGDRPWPQLDLSDGDTLAVMGIQRSDGRFARDEAVRLAGLVEEHSGTEPTRDRFS